MALTEKQNEILNSIIIASENNPSRPEFPPENPRFPATPTYKIKVPGFSNVWLKDESLNPTGTHKDRMAWEIVVTYREFLLTMKRDKIKKTLPQMSIISSGSAAVAIQTIFKKYGLPDLKVLVDNKFSEEIIKSMKKLGCEIYKTDLSAKDLSSKEILKLTDNESGFDITSSDALDPTTRFYDWMSYEIINNNPDYCFVPFGTGNLYENILNVNKKEVSTINHDPRFKGYPDILRKCNFIGATCNDPKSKMDKLYSPHLPFAHYDEQWIKLYVQAGYCGDESGVFNIEERFIDEAMKIAKSQGITCEASGIAGLALLLQMKDKIPKDKKILIVNTGKTKYP